MSLSLPQCRHVKAKEVVRTMMSEVNHKLTGQWEKSFRSPGKKLVGLRNMQGREKRVYRRKRLGKKILSESSQNR